MLGICHMLENKVAKTIWKEAADLHHQPFNQERVYYPFVGPHDPCPPIREKTYVVPPNQFIVFQPMSLPQYSPQEALQIGTLWPIFYSPYGGKKK